MGIHGHNKGSVVEHRYCDLRELLSSKSRMTQGSCHLKVDLTQWLV